MKIQLIENSNRKICGINLFSIVLDYNRGRILTETMNSSNLETSIYVVQIFIKNIKIDLLH